MKIEHQYVGDIEKETMTLEEFADRHNLIMTVGDRGTKEELRYYASFKDVDISEGPLLCSAYGDGNTEDEAMDNYMKRISEETIVIDAYGPKREVIRVPILVALWRQCGP